MLTPTIQSPKLPPGFWQRFTRSRTVVLSLVLLVLILLLALFGPLVYPVDPAQTEFGQPNAPPGATHPLGTDRLGRDTLARLIEALRVSLLVALITEGITVLIGATLGLVAGYFGGLLDTLISRLADVLFAFPGLLLAILVAATFGQWVTETYGSLARLLLVAGSLSLVSWPLMARYVRGQVLSLRERDFVLAARAVGVTPARLLLRHLLPNVGGLVITAATLDAVNAIVGEATLSLLGLGVQAPGASIGKMIAEAAPFLAQNALLVFIPAGTLTLLVLIFAFIGDGLRDALDPLGR